MIINAIIEILNHSDFNVNIIFSSDNYIFNNNNKTIKIDLNYEHTLVKKGGRDIPFDTPYGNITDGNDVYLVRICNYQILNFADIIIDYSNPNIYNVNSCPLFKSFSEKHIYISPSIYKPYFIKENRNITILTTFINTSEPRRNALLCRLNSQMLHTNIHNCFEKNKLQDILKNTKILINIHQTPHHHSFEELRVLPALECGVIVISETSPLYETVPYHNSIIWANYDEIINIVKEVIENYDKYHDKLFSIENRTILENLQKYNYDNLYKNIKKLL